MSNEARSSAFGRRLPEPGSAKLETVRIRAREPACGAGREPRETRHSEARPEPTDPAIKEWLARVFNFDAHEDGLRQDAAILADDPAVRWGQADSLAIRIDENADAWHSGRVNDVLALDSGGLLVGSETGGVWSVTSAGQALPLSNDWDNPDISSLTFGPDGPRHVYAGGSGLYETNTADALPLLAWRQIPLPQGVTGIYRIGVLAGSRRIVLASDNGVWWSPIPAAPSARGTYNWQQAPGLPGGTYSGLAVGPNGTFAVALWGPQNCPGTMTLAGIFTGSWTSGNLQMTCSAINGVTLSQVSWISLASCDSNRNVMYALTTDSNGKLLATLRSNDGGRNWNATGQTLDGIHLARHTIQSLFGDSSAGGWFKHISVSPSNTETVAFDTRSGSPLELNIQIRASQGSAIGRIVVQSTTQAYATLNSGTIAFILRLNGLHWDAVGAGTLFALEMDRTANPPTLFASTDSRVYVSRDSGATWQSASQGLPRRPHCADLRFVAQSDGGHFLYLSTYGRSVWRARL